MTGSRRPPGERLRVVVMGWLVRGPMGGMAWHHLQYVVGLHQLGHDVVYVEDSDDYPSCYHPVTMVTDTDPAEGLAFAGQAFNRLGLDERWAYYDSHAGYWHGPLGQRAQQICRSADVVVNVSGVNPLRPWLEETPIRVLIDTDPAFTQIRHLNDESALAAASRHTAFFSFGENVGEPASRIPDDGLPWQPTRQPIVLDLWPAMPGRADGPFTTVMQWSAYSAVEYAGRHYGMKAESFVSFEDLPRHSSATFELALLSPPEIGDRMSSFGWHLRDPNVVAGDPWSYQAYVQRSAAEFAVAKHGYVASNSGWFSERSAAYLATGRPVLVQDTGLDGILPTGEGIVTFRDRLEALAAVEDVIDRYDAHSAAARDIAEAEFDARNVLSRVLDQAHG